MPTISIPQISYSATSDQLSDGDAYPLFLRTPPSDAYQATVIAATIRAQSWHFVCVIHGTDSYSASGAQSLISQLPDYGLTLRTSVSFEAGTNSVTSQITQLNSQGCRLIVMWAQASDIRTIAIESEKQGLTSDENGVLWFSSEILLGSFSDTCGVTEKDAALCRKVFKGALLVTPNYGPGSGPMYEKLADSWHSQESKVGAATVGSGRTVLTSNHNNNPDPNQRDKCDNTTNSAWSSTTGSGSITQRSNTARQYIWKSDHDSNPSTLMKCTAVDFTDYNRLEATEYLPETSGDGRISNYVPYSYDSLLVAAYGLHDHFQSAEWKNAAENDINQKLLFTGEKLYTSMLNVNFLGFSGKVRFRKGNPQAGNSEAGGSNAEDKSYEGDREASTMEFFLWNYDGKTKFNLVGSVTSNGTLSTNAGNTNIVWPGDGTKPDDRPLCLPVDYNRTMGVCQHVDSKIVAESTSTEITKTTTTNQYGLLVTSTYDKSLCRHSVDTVDARTNTNSSNSNSLTLFNPCLYVPVLSSAGTLVLTITLLGASMQIGALCYAIYQRKTKTMRASQFELLALFTIGLCMTSFTPIAFLGAPTTITCVTRIWYFNISLSIVEGALTVKMWRVWKVFHNKKMSRLKNTLNLTKMLSYIAFIVLFDIVLLIIMTAVEDIRPVPILVPGDTIFPMLGGLGGSSSVPEGSTAAVIVTGSAVHGLCRTKKGSNPVYGTLWSAAQSIFHIGMVGNVAWLSYSLRNEPSEFQESKWLGLIGMNVFSVGSVVGAVYFWMSTDLNYESLVVLQTLGTFVICSIATVLMYLPKMTRIRNGDQTQFNKNKKNKSSADHASSQKTLKEKSSQGHGSCSSGGCSSSVGDQSVEMVSTETYVKVNDNNNKEKEIKEFKKDEDEKEENKEVAVAEP